MSAIAKAHVIGPEEVVARENATIPPDVSAADAAAIEEAIEDSVKETREDMLARHRKETRDLQSKDVAMKKAAAKGSKAEQKAKKKAADDEIARLDSKMKARQAKELAGLGFKGEDPPAGEKKHDKLHKVKMEMESLVKAVAGVTTGVAGALEGKSSKAQKRRSKKMQQEADRDQRILEEQSGVVSERSVENEKLREKLEPQGLTFQDILSDGHCLYRAIEHQLQLQHVNKDYTVVRRLAAGYMRENPKDFKPFVVTEDTSKEERDPEARFEQYCTDVESTATWGGQLELEALSHALKRHIVVVSADAPDVRMGLQYGGSEPTLRVSYHKHAFGSGEHYNSIVPLAEEEEAAVQFLESLKHVA